MPDSAGARITAILRDHPDDLLRDWLKAQPQVSSVSQVDLKSQCAEMLALLSVATASGIESVDGPAWTPIRDFLARLSRARAQSGGSPTETATFVFSLKGPLFARIKDPTDLWAVTRLADELGLYTMEVFMKGREEVILHQQRDMLELSTPVVSLWEGVLALPMIGTLDSARTPVVMESLLQRIVETGSELAIIDITGVPTVDTLTAQHLIKTVTAARLMGAECIISGIRPQIAQTIVHLGVDLGGITTKATLADAFRVALARSGRTVTKI